MKTFIQEILDSGEKALLGRTEHFKLEFKQKEKPDNHILSKADKKNLGKILSGFSNADGGVVIFGIKTETKDHQDVAVDLRPIIDIERFKNEVDGSLGYLLQPSNPLIETHAIPSGKDPSRGYLLIDIGASDYRPHMSTAPDHQKYFRRMVDQTIQMDHNLVRDLMMAPKEAQIQPTWRISGGSYVSLKGKKIVYGFLDLHMQNVGLAMASMPYARVFMNPMLKYGDFHLIPDITTSPRQDGSAAFYGNRNAVIHPSDEIHFSRFKVAIVTERNLIENAKKSEDWADIFTQEHWEFHKNLMIPQQPTPEQVIDNLYGTIDFGAENAQKRTESFHLSKDCLIRLFLEQILKTLREGQINSIALELALKENCPT